MCNVVRFCGGLYFLVLIILLLTLSPQDLLPIEIRILPCLSSDLKSSMPYVRVAVVFAVVEVD